MASVLDFFREEAGSCLAGMRQAVAAANAGELDAAALHAHARRLRGSAQLAKQAEIQALAGEVEATTRALAAGDAAWDRATAGAISAALDRLEPMVAGARAPETDDDIYEPKVDDAMHGDTQALFEKATRLTNELQSAADEHAAEVRDELRETLTSLGVATEDEVVSELVRHAITRLESTGPVGVDGLLPNIRQAMGIRAGGDMAASAAPDDHGATDAAAGSPAPPTEDVVPIGQLLYRGDRALERALELRRELEDHVARDEAGREALDELFELIQLGRS